MKKYLFIITGLVLVTLFACQKYDDPDVKYASTYPVSGEWWVKLYDPDGNALTDYVKLLTYNTTSDKGDSIWIDDLGNTWTFKVKAAINVKAKTFAVDSIRSVSVVDGEPYDIKVDIKNGKVISKGGKSADNNVTDSIFMNIGFGDDSGTVYSISGVRRTGFSEDDF